MFIKPCRMLCVLLLCLWQLSIDPGQAQVKPISVVTVGTSGGQLSVRRKGTASISPLLPRHALYVGDIVFTGPRGRASLLFPDGAQVRLNANASIEITPPRRLRNGKVSLFRALAGQVWARLRPGNAIETRTAILGVRGTEIVLEVGDDGTTTLTVTEGSVDFSNEFGDVIVEQSQQSVARPGAAPTQPVTVANAGFIVEWTLDLDRAVVPREKFYVSLDPKILTAEVSQRALRVQREPDDAYAHRDYADALFDSGKYEQAQQEYETALNLEPQDDALRVRLGYALLESGRFEDAQKYFLGALKDDRIEAQSVDFPSSRASSFLSLDWNTLTQVSSRPKSSPALVGLSTLALQRDRPGQAQRVAQLAVNANSRSVEARIALGVALLRQSNMQDEAIGILQSTLKEPSPAVYQAHAWLALAHLDQDDVAASLREAQRAVALAPHSGLARGNLSLVLFHSGNVSAARREASRALELNPESVAAHTALGQAMLAQGEIDEANAIAAKAVALDPDLPQAHYLLGVSDAGRRDYRHAVAELKTAIELAPDFLAASSALARVYNAMGRPAEGVSLLQNLLPHHRRADAVASALGTLFYEQGRYEESAQSYRRALKARPNSALYHAELARTLLYSNHLQEAIGAARTAVRLAPDIGQFHAILGQAYQFGSLRSQAERHFRTALTLDPKNALALTQLSLQHAGSDLRPAAAGITQGFLLDPAIGNQLLRGGVGAELTAGASTSGGPSSLLTHRSTAAAGRLHSLGIAGRDAGDDAIFGQQGRRIDVAQFLNLQPSPRTNLFANLRYQRDKRALNGNNVDVNVDDQRSFGYTQAQLAVRHRMGRNFLWAGIFGNKSRNTLEDRNLDSSFDESLRWAISNQRYSSRALEPELRFDFSLTRQPGRISTLSFGMASAHTRFDGTNDLVNSNGVLPETLGAPLAKTLATGSRDFRESQRGLLLYSQLAAQVNPRLSVVGQLRWQRWEQNREVNLSMPTSAPLQARDSRSKGQMLPGLLASYRAGQRTTLRFHHNQRLADATVSTFAPTETLVTTQAESLPYGIANRLNLTQLEVDHDISSRSFLRLFFFRSSAQDVQIGFSDSLGFGNGLPAADAPGLRVANWRALGAGMRLEHQLGRGFFADLGLAVRRTQAASGDAIGLPYDGGQAPYEPKFIGQFGLNYLDAKGHRVGVRLRHKGAAFQDSPFALGRPKLASQTYVDLLLARRTSAYSELFLNLTNVFDRPDFAFQNFRTGRRRLNFGVIRGF